MRRLALRISITSHPLPIPLQNLDIEETDAQIVLVQELALLPLLAQSTQPVLAH